MTGDKEKIETALHAGLAYAEDVLADPAQLKCFKPGVVQRDVRIIREAISAYEVKLRTLDSILNKIINECESNMARAREAEKQAKATGHFSEEHHQDGRWHGNNDILEFVERLKQGMTDAAPEAK